MSFCSKLYSYFRLCLNVKNYYTMYLETKHHDLELLQYVTDSISECGAITIKFCQWITPKLELIYLEDNDILNENKPDWLLYLEKYSTSKEKHFGLAFHNYTHFTSPIRRFPDVMVHRLLYKYLNAGKPEDKTYYEILCKHSSKNELQSYFLFLWLFLIYDLKL